MHPSFDYEKALADKGLAFEPEGEQRLLRIDGEPMERMSQKEFEAVGDLVLGFVQQTMRTKYGMKEVWIGDERKPNGPKCNIFVSDDFATNTSRCLVLI